MPKLDSITQEDLSREIRGDDTPKKEPAVFKEENVRVGDDKGHVVEKDLEGFGSAARKMMERKQKEADGGEVETEPKKEEPKKEEAKKKEVVSADDAAPQKKEEPAAGERLPDDQLKVLPHDKPLTVRRIQQLLKDKEDLQKERDEARAAAKANPTASNVEEYTKLKEEHAKANDELIKFRRRYEIDNDDTFKKTYDEPVAHAETAIENTLKKYQLGDATLKAIKDEGGFAAFSRSSKTFAITETDADGQPKTVHRTAAELARNWLTALPVADGEFIRSALGKQAMLAEEKKQAVERAVGESKQFFETRQKQQLEQQEAASKKDKELAAGHAEWIKKTTESTDWMKDKEVPANANDEQRKKIEEHNEFNKQLRARITDNPKTLDEYNALKLDAAHAHHLRRELGTKDEQIKSLQAELARVKGAGRTTPKGGSLLTDAGKPSKKEDDIAPDDFKTGFKRGAARKAGGDDE